MKKFLLLYVSPMSTEEMMKNANPETSMQPWMEWFNEHKEEIVEQGSPTGSEVNITKTGSTKPKTFIGGYTIVQAKSMEAVKELLTDHPQFMMEGGSIEVLEILPTPGM